MIQEIYNCYLIKNHFVYLADEEMVRLAKEEKQQEFYCTSILEILTNEDFFIVSEKLFSKLENLISEIRYDYQNNKKLWELKNEIIVKLNQYRQMPKEIKEEKTDNWFNKEIELRGFPLSVSAESTYSFLIDSVGADCIYIDCLARTKDIPIYNPFQFLGTINVLIKKHPIFFLESLEKTELAFMIVQGFHESNILSQFPKEQAKLLKRQAKKTERLFRKLDNYQLMDIQSEKKLTLDFIKRK